MALSIKDPETDQLARRLAKATGQSLTDAINSALRDKLRIIEGDERTEEQFIADVMKIVERSAKLPVLDPRPADEIIGYDENGLFG
ncbi:type II toxin-antitoxin system VapB family antitoxin [Dongia sp. agr-C8]